MTELIGAVHREANNRLTRTAFVEQRATHPGKKITKEKEKGKMACAVKEVK